MDGCPDHNHNQFVAFDETCNRLICFDCIFEHQGHALKKLEPFQAELREELGRLREQGEARLQIVRNTLKEVDKEVLKGEVEKECAAAVTAIKAEFEKVTPSFDFFCRF